MAPGRGGVVGGVVGGAATRATTGAPTTAATRRLQSLDSALPSLIKVDADEMPLQKLTQWLQDTTQTNMVVNWNALGQGGPHQDHAGGRCI